MNELIVERFSKETYRFPNTVVPEHFRRSAVLVLLWKAENGWTTVVTKRSEKMSKHSGEFCFPGGALDQGESAISGALRETHEELGVSPNEVQVIGRLDDAWSSAGFHLVPIVGVYDGKPSFRANEEVAKVIEVVIESDLEITLVVHIKNGKRYEDPVITTEGSKIFGLTADILLEAIETFNGEPHQRGKSREISLRRIYA